MIHDFSDESYIESLSHIDIRLKNIYYFCVIKYDLPVSDVYFEIFSAHKYELETIDTKIISNNKLDISLENVKWRAFIKDT